LIDSNYILETVSP